MKRITDDKAAYQKFISYLHPAGWILMHAPVTLPSWAARTIKLMGVAA
jgi:hypothetical protein